MDNKVSYYKIIDGLNFDAGLLNMADELHRPKRKMRQDYYKKYNNSFIHLFGRCNRIFYMDKNIF